jgi:hypothetical protein
MTNPILEAATRALLMDSDVNIYVPARTCDVIIAAVTPLIRAKVLEEAALVAENQPSAPLKIGAPQTWIKQQIAAAIRALKSAAPAPSAASA